MSALLLGLHRPGSTLLHRPTQGHEQETVAAS